MTDKTIRDIAGELWDAAIRGDFDSAGKLLSLMRQEPNEVDITAGVGDIAGESVAEIVPCYTPSGKRVALNTEYQHLPIGTKLYAHRENKS